ncbi:protein liaI [Bacillus sp. WMMC1349]|uniref:protein liaI n=1 Tax=Bacillus sp. WMMC1349 TaxID=2736254 RepID=UPI00155776CD|nr:protein liaI [Bacillus sp. WMMC1349]NPC94135.1 protein liaI [Bacillus sp. WMMC1349]
MKITGKSVIGFFLILFGISLFFGGGIFGGLFAGAIGALFVYYAIKKWRKGHQFAAVVLGIIGIMFLGGSLPFLIGMALAVALIYFGWNLIKENSDPEENLFFSGKVEPSAASYDTSFDSEWEDFLKKKQ